MAERNRFALRPMLPVDVPVLAAIFRASIEDLAAEDYSDEQIEAWAARADDQDGFGRTLAATLTLVATENGTPVGFASLEGKNKIAMLYVQPDKARQGVASLLCDALSKLAAARGAEKLIVDASDTARDFFMAQGYTPTIRNMVPVGAEWLGNTTMERSLAVPAHGDGTLH